jgi:hypothetical protein
MLTENVLGKLKTMFLLLYGVSSEKSPWPKYFISLRNVRRQIHSLSSQEDGATLGFLKWNSIQSQFG